MLVLLQNDIWCLVSFPQFWEELPSFLVQKKGAYYTCICIFLRTTPTSTSKGGILHMLIHFSMALRPSLAQRGGGGGGGGLKCPPPLDPPMTMIVLTGPLSCSRLEPFMSASTYFIWKKCVLHSSIFWTTEKVGIYKKFPPTWAVIFNFITLQGKLHEGILQRTLYIYTLIYTCSNFSGDRVLKSIKVACIHKITYIMHILICV